MLCSARTARCSRIFKEYTENQTGWPARVSDLASLATLQLCATNNNFTFPLFMQQKVLRLVPAPLRLDTSPTACLLETKFHLFFTTLNNMSKSKMDVIRMIIIDIAQERNCCTAGNSSTRSTLSLCSSLCSSY